MKSKVILFCVVLLCSEIVDSIPHSEDLVRHRVNPLSNWQVNQNAPNGQYLGTENVNIQQDKAQDFYLNQGRHNYDNNRYNRNPVSSLSGEELSYDPPEDAGSRLNPSSRVESYPSRISQGRFDNQNYRNQNWRSQNQYTNSVPSAVHIPDDVSPTVQEPSYRGPVQYVPPTYVPPLNRRLYSPTAGRSYLTREQFQYLTGGKKYSMNPAPHFGSSGSVPYDSEDQVASEINEQPTGGQTYAQNLASQSGIIYNGAPAVVALDTLTDQTQNINYAENFESGSDLSNNAPITNYDDGLSVTSAQSNDPVHYESYRAAPYEVKSRPIGGGLRFVQNSASQSGNIKYSENYQSASIKNHDDSSPLTSEADDINSDSSNLARGNSKMEAPVVISKISSEKPPARSYANNDYRSGSGWSKSARDDFEYAYGPKEPVPVNTYSGVSSAPTYTDTELENSRNNKHEEAHRGSGSPTTLNTNPKQNLYRKLNSGITEFNLKDLVANPDVQSILAATAKRYLVVHSNGTVEPIDKIDLGSQSNSKLRMVHTNRKNNDADSDGALKQQSPENLPNNIAMTPVPVDEHPLPTNSQPANDKKPTPLYVDQSNPANEYEPKLSPPLKGLPADHGNLKPSLQPGKQPADNNMHVIPPSDDDNSTPLSPNEDQSAQNDHLKPLPQNVNQPGDDDDSKPLPQDENHPVGADNSKLLTSKKVQPADDDSKLDQHKNENNFTPLSPNAGEPANIKKPENSYVKHPANDFNSKPFPKNKNQPDYYRPSYNRRRQHNRSKHSHVNKPTDNSSPWSPNENQPADDSKRKPLSSNEKQPADDSKSKPLPAHATQSSNGTKFKPSNGDEAGYDNQNSNTSSPDENQAEEDKKSKLLRPDENQPTDNLNSTPNPAVASKNDDQSNSTTVSPTVSSYTTSSKPKTHSKHFHHKSATNSPVVSTTPCPDDASEDQIITLSPIEQATDNVSDVPPETTTTTTTMPVINPEKSDTINDAKNKQDDVHSTTTLSPSSSASPTDNISDDKTIGTVENKNTQTNDKTVEDQVKNGKKDNRTAVYNSSELFDTNTDVPAESDDYSSVTASPSVQNDVNTGDASGDNSLELEQSETVVAITVSSSTANDSEDEIISINIEISESNADDADKSLVVSINTNDDNDDDSKKPKPENCKKYHNSDDGRGKNIEIDMSNLKGEPTMWIKTTNQDFIDKMTAKNDTEYDVIYFFNIVNQPVIEREKTTTIHCNGTVVTEITELTYENKDDPAPTIVKSTKTTQNDTEVIV